LRHPQRLFDVPLNEPELFTANPAWLAFLREDSFALRQATARLLLESVRLDLYLRVVARAVRVPALVLLAGQDRIIDNRRTRRFVRRFRGPCSIIEYANAHHTLEFEPNPEVYMGDLTYWLGSIHSGLH
jgi:alpha-beta hydrolase superfamily lysophospholipase